MDHSNASTGTLEAQIIQTALRWSPWPEQCGICGSEPLYIHTTSPPDWACDGDPVVCLACGEMGFANCDEDCCVEIDWRCQPGEHAWRTMRQGGDPAELGSYEHITYCVECGCEYEEGL